MAKTELKFQKPTGLRPEIMDAALPLNPTNNRTTDANCKYAADPTGDDWLQITTRMADGNSQALTAYYEFTFDLMFNEISRISGRDEQTCLDIVHESMLKAIRSIKPLPDSIALFAWSKAVAKSATYDWLRRESRVKKLDDKIYSEPCNRNEPARDYCLDQARMVWLEEQLSELPHELRHLISLRFRFGWSLKRIGSKMGLKTGAVDGRIRRALDQIKLKANSFDEDVL